MGLETATYISDLNSANPVGASDNASTLDDHIRLIKSTVKTTFPNVTGAVTATHTELNYAVGLTSAAQTQLTAKAAWTVVTGPSPSPSAARVQSVVITGDSGTCTLPASPTTGDTLFIVTSGNSNVVAPNAGQTIDGSGSSKTITNGTAAIVIAASSTAWIYGAG